MSDTNERSVASAGSQPVAWAVIPGTVLAGRAWRVTLDREEAEQLSCGAMLVVPLYEQPQPALTDEERDAVGRAAMLIDDALIDDSDLALHDCEALRGLYALTQI